MERYEIRKKINKICKELPLYALEKYFIVVKTQNKLHFTIHYFYLWPRRLHNQGTYDSHCLRAQNS
jgi:hypothetical protein